MATTTKCGWYGTDSETFFVSESGRVYLVQTEDTIDLSGGPRLVAGLPDVVEPIPTAMLDAELCASVADCD